MVKRVLAVVLGALAGVALFYAVAWARERIHDSQSISVNDCVSNGVVDCVRFKTPTAPPAAMPCKAWLAQTDSPAALLSECLHEARSEDGVRAARAQSIATSS